MGEGGENAAARVHSWCAACLLGRWMAAFRHASASTAVDGSSPPSHHTRTPRTPRVEDPMLEEVAASFAATSASTCANSTMVSHPTQLAADSVPMPLQDGRSQVTPPRAAQTTSGADAHAHDEVGGPPDFGPAEPAAVVVDMFSTPPQEDRTVVVSDSSAASRASLGAC